MFSKEEPKGVDCIEHFKTMQDCFREHPDIYGAELIDDEDDLAAPEESNAPAPGAQHAVDVAREKINDTVEHAADAISTDASKVVSKAQKNAEDVAAPSTKPKQGPTHSHSDSDDNHRRSVLGDEGGDLVPKAAHDARSEPENVGTKTQK